MNESLFLKSMILINKSFVGGEIKVIEGLVVATRVGSALVDSMTTEVLPLLTNHSTEHILKVTQT